MDGDKARKILEDLKNQSQFVEYDKNVSQVTLDGVFTIEELQAVLHVMEYND